MRNTHRCQEKKTIRMGMRTDHTNAHTIANTNANDNMNMNIHVDTDANANANGNADEHGC